MTASISIKDPVMARVDAACPVDVRIRLVPAEPQEPFLLISSGRSGPRVARVAAGGRPKVPIRRAQWLCAYGPAGQMLKTSAA
jgi:hypothetical protein